MGTSLPFTKASSLAADEPPAEPGLVQIASDLKFPEGPAYDGKGNIYVSNCFADYITKITEDGAESIAFKAMNAMDGPWTFQKTNGMTFYKDGSLFICDEKRKAIVHLVPPYGYQDSYASSWEGQPFRAPNDLAFDKQGNLYFTDPGDSSLARPIGSVYRVEKDTKKVTRAATGLAFPNGLAFSADGQFLYLCESQHNRILRYPVKDDGNLGDIQIFADLSPAGKGEPDGMAVDSAGNLWVAHYGTSAVLVINPQGKIIRTIRLPHRNNAGPTNLEFGGKDFKMLYITHPGMNGLFRLPVETAGLPLFCGPAG